MMPSIRPVVVFGPLNLVPMGKHFFFERMEGFHLSHSLIRI